MYERGLREEDIVALFLFMDRIMTLPAPLERRFEEELEAYEEEKKMPALAPFERRAINKGKREGKKEGALENARECVVTAVETHWSKVPSGIEEAVNRIEDMARLRGLLREAMTAGTLEEFERKLNE
ncbi:MAG: hypothetical protein M3Y56_15270 [Armatimonadota bacterium]|nr:hypothetical protein [Armatimonadota bacterium]